MARPTRLKRGIFPLTEDLFARKGHSWLRGRTEVATVRRGSNETYRKSRLPPTLLLTIRNPQATILPECTTRCVASSYITYKGSRYFHEHRPQERRSTLHSRILRALMPLRSLANSFQHGSDGRWILSTVLCHGGTLSSAHSLHWGIERYFTILDDRSQRFELNTRDRQPQGATRDLYALAQRGAGVRGRGYRWRETLVC